MEKKGHRIRKVYDKTYFAPCIEIGEEAQEDFCASSLLILYIPLSNPYFYDLLKCSLCGYTLQINIFKGKFLWEYQSIMIIIMKHYKAIIFDLFGTLVDFDVTLLPPLKLHEEEIYCTTVPLFETASKIHYSGSLDAFHRTLQAVIQRSRDEKKISLKEISCLTQMKTLLEHLHFPENEETRELAVRMKDLHMGLMKKCVFLPRGHLPLFLWMSTGLPPSFL